MRVLEVCGEVNLPTRAIRARGCKMEEDPPGRGEEVVDLPLGDPETEPSQRTGS
jgi:hypothetical protein